VPPQLIPPNRGASVDDGIYLTRLPTGKRQLLVSLDEIVRAIQLPLKEYKSGDFYGFHVKWNPQGDRLMFVLRWLPRDRRFPLLKRFQKKPKLKLNLVTLKPDGSDIHLAIPDAEWSKGGHHPNWCPDGETILMNLNLHGDGLRFVRVKYDGTECEAMTQKLLGSGHPTLHPDEKHILTDAYPHEPVAFGDGTTPLRWVDFDRGEEQTLIRIQTAPSFRGPKGQLRVDPHPAWDRQSRRIAFNACPDGTRRVYVADLSQLL
jgi:hypothetical protein